MRKLVLLLLAALIGAPTIMTVAGCGIECGRRDRRRKKYKKHKKYKKYKHKKHKEYYEEGYHKPKGQPPIATTLEAFLGGSGDVYLAMVPVRMGQTADQVSATLGPRRKRTFTTPQGEIKVKVGVGPEGKVSEIKAKLMMPMASVEPLAKKKWGEGKKKADGTWKWVRGDVKILLEMKKGQPVILIRPEAKGGGGVKEAATDKGKTEKGKSE